MARLVNPYRFLAGGSPPVPTDWWRVYFLGADGGVVALSQMEVASTAGGSDLLAGALSIAANWQDAFFPVTHLSDGSTTSFWFSDRSLGAYVDFQLAAPILEIAEVRIRARDDATWRRQAPGGFLIRKSYDSGATWNTVSIVRGQATWSANELRTLTPAVFSPGSTPADAIIWGIQVTDTQTNTNLGIEEMEMSVSSGGTNLCTGGSASNDGASFSAAAEPYLAFTPGTNLFYSATGRYAGFFGYLFDAPISTPGYLRITAPSVFNTDHAPKNFDIRYSCDGLTWTVTDTPATQTGWSLNETREFAITP